MLDQPLPIVSSPAPSRRQLPASVGWCAIECDADLRRLEPGQCACLEELHEIRSEEGCIHGAAARQDAAVRELCISLPSGMHGKREQGPALDLGGDDGVTAGVSNGRDDPVQSPQSLAVDIGANWASIGSYAHPHDASRAVREARHGLGNLDRENPLLELHVLRLLREGGPELGRRRVRGRVRPGRPSLFCRSCTLLVGRYPKFAITRPTRRAPRQSARLSVFGSGRRGRTE